MDDYFMRIFDYLQSGGVVMLPILGVSFLMWVLIINRMLYMRNMFYNNMALSLARDLVKQNRLPNKMYQGVNALLVKKFIAKRSGNLNLDKYILDEIVMNLASQQDRYLALITILSGVAPLLGLLGTVTGMMVTFDVITFFGTGNAKAMADGISEALITTQTGLLVAIPGLYMSGFLNNRAKNLKQRTVAAGMYIKRYIKET